MYSVYGKINMMMMMLECDIGIGTVSICPSSHAAVDSKLKTVGS